MRRVDEAIRQVIGAAVAGELKDPRVGFVTVTDVRTSADLSHARVYVSVLGDDAQRADSMSGLQSAHGYLQRRVASELHLKRTPTLTFTYDSTTDRALRVEELLEGGAAGRRPAGRNGDSRRRRVSPGFGRAPRFADTQEIEGP
jgi:ribosome-binding factor A